jgi:hypothetical protein
MTSKANRFFVMAVLGLAWGCASETDMPVASELVGTWEVTSARLAMLEPGTEKMVTAPVMVYPDSEARAPYLDKTGSVGLRFASAMVFHGDGQLQNSRSIQVDGELISEVTSGVWYLEGGELIFKDPVQGFRVFFTPTLWSHDELHLKADRDNPEFSDSSCVYELTLKRRGSLQQ